MLVYVAVPGHNVAMAGVDPRAGRIAADRIRAAQQRHVPLLTVHEAARQAGITDDGWSKVIRTGRGREGTFMAMARVAGVEPEVRDALGLPPLDANVVRMPAPGDLIPEDSYEEAVLASPKASPALKRAAIEYHRAGGREAMAKLGFFPRRLDKARYGN